MKSESLAELATALSAFQSECGNVPFDSVNPHFKNKYASLAGIVDHTGPLLGKHGLSVSQLIDGDNVRTLLLHKSGQWLQSSIPVKKQQDTAQGYGAGLTYARRYAYAAILGIASDEDDDGNAATRPPVAQNATKDAPPVQQAQKKTAQPSAMLFKRKTDAGNFEMVTIDKLRPTQIEWYAKNGADEARREVADHYILTHAELFVKQEGEKA